MAMPFTEEPTVKAGTFPKTFLSVQPNLKDTEDFEYLF